MYCPFCSTQAPADQKFCRVCGLNLSPHNELLTEQLAHADWAGGSANSIEALVLKRKRLRAGGIGILLACLAALMVFLISIKGLAAIWVAVFLAALVAAIFLMSYAEALPKSVASARGANSARLSSSPKALPRQPAPSITEHTTHLLDRDERDAESRPPRPERYSA